MSLKVIAFAAPELLRGNIGGGVLASQDPASLYNACRYCATLTENTDSPWSDSNWVGKRSDRKASIILMHSLEDDLPKLDRLLTEVSPNLVLVGAMTPCFPGAISCCTYIKQRLGKRVCIVLGGKHANETIFEALDGGISHHRASPIGLMLSKRIPGCFDFVVSGDGEELISKIGDFIDHCDRRQLSEYKHSSIIKFVKGAAGDWILSWIENDAVHNLISNKVPLDRTIMKTPAEAFGVSTFFNVFNGRPTAHVFSDSGAGCIFDCTFCSERRSVNGTMYDLSGSARRLFHQLYSASKVIREDYIGLEPSAFVEDSTMLAGRPASLRQLAELLCESNIGIKFGGQFTIDQIPDRMDSISALSKCGFEYIFTGIETPDPQLIGGMSKDIKHSRGAWMSRVESVLALLTTNQVKCGAALLFGLGESHGSRIELLEQIAKWRDQFRNPCIISMNWAVQHPLRGTTGYAEYDYTEWGLPDDHWIDAFREFGEATFRYPLIGQLPPKAEHIADINASLRSLNLLQPILS